MKAIIKNIKKNIALTDKTLLTLSVIMFVFGLFNIVSASSSEAIVRYDASIYQFFVKQLVILLGGVVAFFIILNIDTKKYIPLALGAFIVISMASIYLTVSGAAHKGAKNWLPIFGSSLQPSEFAKIIIIVCLALIFDLFYNKIRKKDGSKAEVLGLITVVGLALPILVMIQKDLGTAGIMLMIFGVMFLTSPILVKDKLRMMGSIGIISVIGFLLIFSVKGNPFTGAQMSRLTYIDPCSRYETGGYQTCNGYIAINDGGLFGLGTGKSTQKYSYIPEPHTDSVFAIIAEEHGFLFSTLIFFAYIVILKRIILISSNASTIRGRYMALGIATYLFAHIFINLGGLLAVIPLTGVPLPFLSYGGSYALSLVVALGIVQRIHIETKKQNLKLH